MNPKVPPEVPYNAMLVDCRPACECGCERPARVEIIFGGNLFRITDPIKVDYLVDKLVKGRIAIWGPRPAAGGDPSGS